MYSMKKIILVSLIFLVSTGCQISYYLKSGYHQALLIKNQEPVEEILKTSVLSQNQKNKLQLIREAKVFAETQLGLAPTSNYTSYVQLDRAYVTHIVQVAYPYELKYKNWDFPIVGSLPYKGFFEIEDAKKEAKTMDEQGYDTYIRGVRAYSTLGWMKDPVLSSMLDYEDDDLVNLIIHELTHSTLFIKNSADFNEQLAIFIGNKGTELFFLNKNKKDILGLIANKNSDDLIFSAFINKEYIALKEWYSQNQKPTNEQKAEKFKEIQKRFSSLNLKTDQYRFFPKMELNNASFLGFKTYMNDLSAFERVFANSGSMPEFLKTMKSLEKSKDPESQLAQLSSSTK